MPVCTVWESNALTQKTTAYLSVTKNMTRKHAVVGIQQDRCFLPTTHNVTDTEAKQVTGNPIPYLAKDPLCHELFTSIPNTSKKTLT